MLMNMTLGGGKTPPKTIAGEKQPDMFPVTYDAPEGYDGWSSLTVIAPKNLGAENIKKGVTIANVTGTYETPYSLQAKEVTPEQFPETVIADAEYDALGSVQIQAPDNLEADNIKEGVTIAGITGTYSGGGTTVGYDASGYRDTATVTASDLADATTIGQYAFYKCASLRSVAFGSNTTSIGTYAFSNCTSLSSISWGGVTSIGSYAFQGCTSLKVTTVPSSVATLSAGCFQRCGMTTFTVPTTVTSLGSAFMNCESLTKITLPSNLTTIPNSLAAYCTNLNTCACPSNVTKIENSAFRGTGFTSYTIPSKVTSIGYTVFNQCTKLATLTMAPTTPPTIQNTTFTGTPSSMTIKVPKASLSAYKAATNWSTYASQMVGY